MTHPLIAAVQASIGALIDGLPAMELTGLEQLTAVEELLTATHRVDGAVAVVMHDLQAQKVTVRETGLGPHRWLVGSEHLSETAASAVISAARAVKDYPAAAQALLAGEITIDHVRQITIAADAVGPDLREVMAKELTEASRFCDPSSLGRLAREARLRVGADDSREAAEQRQYDSRWLTLRRVFDGMSSITGMLDPATAAALETALAPLLNTSTPSPTQPVDPDLPRDDRSLGQRRADALKAICELAVRSTQLPQLNGENAHVIVTIPFSDLAAKLASTGLATLNGKWEVSASTARMLACDAGIIPAVLGGASEVLDLGRKQRTWTPAQRRALTLQHPGCQFTGCDAPLAHCQIHHGLHWTAHQGPTDLWNAYNLCGFHHWLIHHTDWDITRNKDGTIRVYRT